MYFWYYTEELCCGAISDVDNGPTQWLSTPHARLRPRFHSRTTLSPLSLSHSQTWRSISLLFSSQVDHDDPRDLSLLRFNALWEAHHRPDSLLVFSTGRSPPSLRLLRAHKPLLTPDIAVMSVGTEIAYGHSMVADEGWRELMSLGWDRNVVVQETSKFPELVPQVG